MTASRFRNKYQTQIARYWNRRYRIGVHGDDGVIHYFTPTVSVQEVATAANAHFVADVRRLHVYRSEVTDGRCILYSDAVKSRPKGPITNLGWRFTFGATRAKLVQRQTLNDLAGVNFNLNFANNSAQIANMPTFTTIATTYLQGRETRPLVILLVTGYRSANEGSQWSQRRAAEVKKQLKVRGIQDHLVATLDGGVGPLAAAQVTLEPASIQNILNLPNNFPIAAHEFGHQLGLVDEYHRRGVDPAQDPSYREVRLAAQQYRVPLPQFDSFTTSLMSVGDQVLPFHYIPFAAAIRALQWEWSRRHDEWAQLEGNIRRNGPNSAIHVDPNSLRSSLAGDESLGLDNLFA